MKLCECGCGRAIVPKPTHRYRPPRFLLGHMSPEGKERTRFNKKRIKPPSNKIPSGICQCGCGQSPTGIAKRHVASKGWYTGYHVPYLPGHSPKLLREQNRSWKGGRLKNHQGYVLLYLPDYPSAGKKGYVLEHRYVWEQANGRLLTSDEHVHHINGIKDDNRLENLVMLTRSAHAREHGPERMRKAQGRHPDMASRGGKLGAEARWGKHS